MKRLLCFSLIAGLCYLPGCSDGGGAATFDPTSVEDQTADEIQEAKDYEKFMKDQDAASGDAASAESS